MWIVGGIVVLIIFMNQQKTDEKKEIKLFCNSEEPANIGYSEVHSNKELKQDSKLIYGWC